MSDTLDSERVERAAARMTDSSRFLRAIAAIDLLNNEDPKRVSTGENEIGYELYFSQLLFAKTLFLEKEASEALLIAARSQHICRWKMPRSDYPGGKAGYLSWRSDLKQYHASLTTEVLTGLGYDEPTIESIRSINLKKDLKRNPNAQTMEDALCLVFLENQFPEFRLRTPDEKMITILQKTWAKMSERGQQAALNLKLGEEESRLVGLALSG